MFQSFSFAANYQIHALDHKNAANKILEVWNFFKWLIHAVC